MKETAIVYMVAGISSRFGGKIKQLAKVGPHNETLIEYSLNQALKAGFNKIIFIVGNLTEKPFKEKFGNQYQGIPIKYALQKYDPKKRDKPWGTLDALCSAKDLIKSPFVLCNGDDIYGEKSFKILHNHLQKKETCATLGYRLGNVVPNKGNVNRGIFKTNHNNNNNIVMSIEEIFDITKENLASKNLSKDSLCSMNIFALNQKILKNLGKILIEFKNKHQENKKIECLLPVELTNLIKKDHLIMELYSTPEKWFGLTNPEDTSIVQEQLKNI